MKPPDYRHKERVRAGADAEQARLEAEQAAQRRAAYQAARAAEDARIQDLVARQQVIFDMLHVITKVSRL